MDAPFLNACMFLSVGGSLDVYRRIPEHVLGRIAVAVSLFFIIFINALWNSWPGLLEALRNPVHFSGSFLGKLVIIKNNCMA